MIGWLPTIQYRHLSINPYRQSSQRTSPWPFTHGDSMRLRHAVIAAAIAPASLLALAIMPSAAHADDDPPASCSITDTSPDTIALGVKAQKVKFDVGTDCDDSAYDVGWFISAENYQGSAHVSWLQVCNYDYSGPSEPDCLHNGSHTMDVVGTGQFLGNQMAGTHNFSVYAFLDVNGDDRPSADEPDDRTSSSFTLLKKTTFGSSFDATPEPVYRGDKLKITGQIQRANWDTGKYEKFGAWVMLQFRATGDDDYSNVKWVWDNGAHASTSVTATRSGSWRYEFEGSGTEASSDSKADTVTVKTRRNAATRLIVTAGAYCKDSQIGDIGWSTSGHEYRCSYYPSSRRDRWKRV